MNFIDLAGMLWNLLIMNILPMISALLVVTGIFAILRNAAKTAEKKGKKLFRWR